MYLYCLHDYCSVLTISNSYYNHCVSLLSLYLSLSVSLSLSLSLSVSLSVPQYLSQSLNLSLSVSLYVSVVRYHSYIPCRQSIPTSYQSYISPQHLYLSFHAISCISTTLYTIFLSFPSILFLFPLHLFIISPQSPHQGTYIPIKSVFRLYSIALAEMLSHYSRPAHMLTTIARA